MKINIFCVITLIMVLFTTMEIFGQSAYIRIVDDKFIPSVKDTDGHIQVETTNQCGLWLNSFSMS